MIHKMCGLSPNKNSLPNLLSWFLDSWATLDCRIVHGGEVHKYNWNQNFAYIRWSSKNVLVPEEALHYSPILVRTMPTISETGFFKTNNLRPRCINIISQGTTRDLVLKTNSTTFLLQAFVSLARQNWLVQGSFLPCFSFSDNFRNWTLKGSFIKKTCIRS